MRIVLQNRESLLYFQQPDRWIAEVGQATIFDHVQTALEFARQQSEWPQLDAVMVFSERKYDVRLPLGP